MPSDDPIFARCTLPHEKKGGRCRSVCIVETRAGSLDFMCELPKGHTGNHQRSGLSRINGRQWVCLWAPSGDGNGGGIPLPEVPELIS